MMQLSVGLSAKSSPSQAVSISISCRDGVNNANLAGGLVRNGRVTRDQALKAKLFEEALEHAARRRAGR